MFSKTPIFSTSSSWNTLGLSGGRLESFAVFKNISVLEADRVIAETHGGYGAEGFVYQGYAEMPAFDGNYPVIGSWVIASQPAGMGIREDATAITRDTSRFVPHFFE